MSLVEQFLTISLFHFLAIAAPGPDYMLVIRNTIRGGEKAGIATAMGLGLGVLTHVALVMLGISALLTNSDIYLWFQLFSSMIITLIGFSILASYYRSQPSSIQEAQMVGQSEIYISKKLAFSQAYITNISNPKVILFFITLFSQIVSHNSPTWFRVLCGLEIAFATTLFYSIVACLLAKGSSSNRLNKILKKSEPILGCGLLLLGFYSFVGSFL